MNTKLLTIAVLIGITFVACKKDDPVEPTPAPMVTTGTAAMSFNFMYGTTPFTLGNTYMDGAGNNVRFDNVKFYVSDIELHDDVDVTIAEFNDVFLLVDASAASNSFTLGTMDAQHIHEAHFSLGLNNTVNHADPLIAIYPLNVPEMHWSWSPTAGYKFLVIEGIVDGNNDGDFDDTEDLGVEYHCATDAMLREAHIHVHETLVAGATLTMAANVDVATLVSGLDFMTTPTSHGGMAPNAMAMDSLVTSIQGM
ncbi:MAG: hypothetical protein IPI00_10940 [Flavobacteriales bacterium]|nr:hypothetical protein [Flavobacteriales bacterium]MBK6943437.1 hypothetical protein [Flavobacteriales bacterium]MBK7240676.1 hypothetical protein [Flavobacteriales bacterium]MBK7297365.1 hypothetical protein [Flavobacteriales bacterium]MBK9536027.1 hypothetical protein [Flavobacteriales bacterium]